ncbi:helix-turn-helix domain-containing protein [Anaerosalibacter sp. Marseille-P3206]|uniref:helix-turn-helix domain-containing protein n=1 Tax=Anaerosalibacter sp. Marseille-P3206 TaxID=1871005 RepID=UPI00098565F6|nr:helix-turn-helix transcriptional regulator [Anaerosalibacter sp. Marseille-P3206]
MKGLRAKRGYTQKQLGERIGISQVYISRIENGDIDGLTIGKLIRIAKVLKVTPAYFLKKLLKAKEDKDVSNKS